MVSALILMLAISMPAENTLYAQAVERLELAQTYDCSKKTCKQIRTCEEACYKLVQCGHVARDRDRDGIPCENLCSRPCR